MIISEFLSARDVVVDLAVADKGKVLQELGSRAAAVLELRPEPIVTGLLKREGLGLHRDGRRRRHPACAA